jgi:large subunit ribosomal protein L1
MGKKFVAAAESFDRETTFTAAAAVAKVKEMAFAKFDESVDAAYLLGIDPKSADQAIRGTVSLPHGTGKSVRIAVFAEGEAANAARDAGADIVGGKELAEEIAGGRELDFDLTIAAPEFMAEVGKLGRVLGPRGLMPNPKAGTVTPDVAKAVQEFKAGKVEYRNDRYGNVHVSIGKVSFEPEQLIANLATITDEILRARPPSSKGRYVKKLTLSSSMGPGIHIDPGALDELVATVR